MNAALWTGGALGAIALYVSVGSLVGKCLKRNSEQYPATPPKGDAK